MREEDILCPCCLCLCVRVVQGHKLLILFLPLLQTSGDPANEFTAIRVHYGIAVMSVTESCNVLCVSVLLQHGLIDSTRK